MTPTVTSSDTTTYGDQRVRDQHAPRSLIVTLYGAYGRFVPGPVPVAELIRLLAAVGVDAPSVRSSVSRLKRRGLLLPARTAQGAAGYELSPDARQLLDDGDRRIYGTPSEEDEGWVVAGVLRAGVGAAETACAAFAPGRSRLRHGGTRGVARPSVAVRGGPAHPGAAAARSVRRLLPRRAPRLRADPGSGRPLVGPGRDRQGARGVSRRPRACAARLGAAHGHPASGGVPRLPPRPGLLAPSPLRRHPGRLCRCCRRAGRVAGRRRCSGDCTSGCATRGPRSSG
ncbi:hypothetical protein SALBM311S_01545 [Streptomyces alboniger]